MDTFELDRSYMDQKYPDPAFPAETGMDAETLRAGLEKLFEQNRELPHPLAKARAVEFVLDHTRIDVSPHDWFIGCGEWGRKTIEPIFCAAWKQQVIDGMPEAVRNDFLQLSRNRFTCFVFDFAHAVPDWQAILRLGISGMLDRVKYYRAMRRTLGRALPSDELFFDSLEIALSAAVRWIHRLRELAERNAETFGGRSEKAAECLRHLSEGGAKSFYDALQQIWLFHILSESIDCIQARSLGNLDQLLYPFYRHDLECGTFTEAELREILHYFMYQMTALHYFWGHPFYLGGTDERGHSAVNELTRMILDVYEEAGIYDPKIQLKISPDTPPDFLKRVLAMVRRGRNSIVFVGEPCIMRTMIRNGYTQEEARTADIKGCYEYTARAAAVETAPFCINSAKIISLTIGNGVDPDTGFDSGLRTGGSAELATFTDFQRAAQEQLRSIGERAMACANYFESFLGEINPALFFSAASVRALELGIDGYARGARYNNSNIWIQFPATAGDSLAAVRRVVYERRQLTLEEFCEALKRDWTGFEAIRSEILNDPVRYGNDRDEADRPLVELVENFARTFNGRANARGGVYTTALHSASDFFQWAPLVGATADGRKRGDELSKNISPVSGRNWAGVTALINSALKFDTSLFAADFPVDLMLHPSAVADDEGLDAMYSLLMAYIKGYGHAIQFNTFDADVLRDAQKHPERYRDLQVRVCGWNVLWNNLSRKEQDNYILQAEAHAC